MRKKLIYGLALAVIGTATVVSVPKTNAQGVYGGMMGRNGYGAMTGSGDGYGMMGNNGPGMLSGCSMMGATAGSKISTFAAGRVAFLKAELGITDAQRSAWDPYAEAIKGNLQSMQGMWQAMQIVVEAKTPADRLDAQIAAMQSRVAALKEVKPALEKLYAALSDEQKKKADEILTGMGCMT